MVILLGIFLYLTKNHKANVIRFFSDYKSVL